MRPPNKSRR